MDPQNFGPDCILCHDLKVLLRQNFNSLSQVYVAACSSRSRPAPYASFLDSVATKFPWSRQNSFLQHIHSVATEFPMSRQILCDYWNSYVATLTILSRHYLCAASSN